MGRAQLKGLDLHARRNQDLGHAPEPVRSPLPALHARVRHHQSAEHEAENVELHRVVPLRLQRQQEE